MWLEITAYVEASAIGADDGLKVVPPQPAKVWVNLDEAAWMWIGDNLAAFALSSGDEFKTYEPSEIDILKQYLSTNTFSGKVPKDGKVSKNGAVHSS